MANEPNKIIYSMIKVSKKYKDQVVLKDISLSYFTAPRSVSWA